MCHGADFSNFMRCVICNVTRAQDSSKEKIGKIVKITSQITTIDLLCIHSRPVNSAFFFLKWKKKNRQTNFVEGNKNSHVCHGAYFSTGYQVELGVDRSG